MNSENKKLDSKIEKAYDLLKRRIEYLEGWIGGMRIYIQPTEPTDPAAHIWIDTNGIDHIL